MGRPDCTEGTDANGERYNDCGDHLLAIIFLVVFQVPSCVTEIQLQVSEPDVVTDSLELCAAEYGSRHSLERFYLVPAHTGHLICW